ncbi:MAG: hypothetical protein KDD33_13735, partial [Bdellovibrionales bacterium]|nr:hypothetical protein [Bdellovibrionales bacterium]
MGSAKLKKDLIFISGVMGMFAGILTVLLIQYFASATMPEAQSKTVIPEQDQIDEAWPSRFANTFKHIEQIRKGMVSGWGQAFASNYQINTIDDGDSVVFEIQFKGKVDDGTLNVNVE